MKTKIINILNHPLRGTQLSGQLEKHIKEGEADFIKLDNNQLLYFYRSDFHHRLAAYVLEKTDEFNLECWRPYGNSIKEIYAKNIDGITHKLFPSNSFYIPYLGSFVWSTILLQEIKKEISKNDIILHLHDGHSRFITWLILKLNDHVPLVYQHRGHAFSNFVYKYSKKKYNIIPLLEFYLQKRAAKKITYYLAGAQPEKKFVAEKLGLKNYNYFHDGIDFSYFKPGTNKSLLRQELGLNENSEIILYVGLFTGIKNIDKILPIYQKIKTEIQNIQLVAIGGAKSDEFYKALLKAGAIVFERMRRSELLKFIQAADIYIMPTLDNLTVNFGGFGSAPLEALACNVPVVTNNIIHFNGSIAERQTIGIEMGTDQNQIEKNLRYMIANYKTYSNVRETTKKYYDNDMMINKLINIYRTLGEEYFKD